MKYLDNLKYVPAVLMTLMMSEDIHCVGKRRIPPTILVFLMMPKDLYIHCFGSLGL